MRFATETIKALLGSFILGITMIAVGIAFVITAPLWAVMAAIQSGRKNITNRELCQTAGVSVPTFWRIRRYKNRPFADTLDKLENAVKTMKPRVKPLRK